MATTATTPLPRKGRAPEVPGGAVQGAYARSAHARSARDTGGER